MPTSIHIWVVPEYAITLCPSSSQFYRGSKELNAKHHLCSVLLKSAFPTRPPARSHSEKAVYRRRICMMAFSQSAPQTEECTFGRLGPVRRFETSFATIKGQQAA
uniref:Secreted protein n=1 Tax=Steinernema glaseri TaxID=37863 RepID=A0A1I7ZGH9_9BILA